MPQQPGSVRRRQNPSKNKPSKNKSKSKSKKSKSKITGRDVSKEKEQKIIPLKKLDFQKGMISEIEDWI